METRIPGIQKYLGALGAKKLIAGVAANEGSRKATTILWQSPCATLDKVPQAPVASAFCFCLPPHFLSYLPSHPTPVYLQIKSILPWVPTLGYQIDGKVHVLTPLSTNN